MFWADQIAQNVIKSGKHQPYWVDDMKTPSGRVHVGALRGVVIHGLIYQALMDQGQKATSSYIFNDMDPMDGFPHYLPDSFRDHMGKPLFRIPSPEPGFDSMAHCYGQEFISVFNSLGFKPDIYWSSELYGQGKFDAVIKSALDQVETIRHLYHDISNYDKPNNWYPYQVFCEQCGKVGSTIVTGWDGREVTYECRKDLVAWAKGCGHHGKITPTGVHGKFMWKVDWAAHWRVLGITIEGAGKDHMSAHGSHDLSSAIVEQIFNYPTPYGFIYEWFLAKGGSKMSSSKGIGVSAKEISGTIPPEILRFLLVKTPYRRAIVFDPDNNQSILKLFDEYDECAQAYYENPDSDEARIWQLSQTTKPPKDKLYYPRFRDVVNFIQNPTINLEKEFAGRKGSDLTSQETSELEKRVKYALIWLDRYAPDKYNFQITDTPPSSIADLSSTQKAYLQKVADLLSENNLTPETFQQTLYETAKSMGLSTKLAFKAIYISLLDKDHGPKAAWLILQNQSVAKDRFAKINQVEDKQTSDQAIHFTQSKNISLSPGFSQKYPSATIGYAQIQGITVNQSNQELEAERQAFAQKMQGISTQDINQLPQILSYRRMYKDMGVDWHSKRPSPEALLRRLATGKGLYDPINSCVDAYNLVVMQRHVSAGAFDADKLKLPVQVKIASGGEQAFYIGDKDTPTVVKTGEVCYFDQMGPYNIDYNYRDALRTSVTLETKNIWINTEGIYDITPHEVKATLDATIDIIVKYCGGKVVEQGLLKA